MLVKKSDIIGIEMVNVDIKQQAENEKLEIIENNFCVRFHLANNDGYIDIPCFYTAGFDLDYMPELATEQLQLTQAHIDAYPDDAYIELNSSLLYNMDVYH